MLVDAFLDKRTGNDAATQAKIDAAVDKFYASNHVAICQECDKINTLRFEDPIYRQDERRFAASVFTQCRECRADVVVLSHADLLLNNLTWLPFGIREYCDIPTRYFQKAKQVESSTKSKDKAIEATIAAVMLSLLTIVFALYVFFG